MHEIYRQAFLLNFNHSIAIRKTIALYKDLIQSNNNSNNNNNNNANESPIYVLEPPDDSNVIVANRATTIGSNVDEDCGYAMDDVVASKSSNFVRPTLRLRNDSYLGAINKENIIVRAGMQNILQLFMTHAANVFLLEVNQHFTTLLEEQTDACKRVLNIYRYMVMHTRMDNLTW